MPPINNYKRNSCDYTLPSGWGGYMYAVDDNGERMRCGHPFERFSAVDIIGIDKFNKIYRDQFNVYAAHLPEDIAQSILSSWVPLTLRDIIWIMEERHYLYKGSALVKLFNDYRDERTGGIRNCVCYDCTEQFDIDIERDEKTCPKCGSSHIKTVRELVGMTCPQCKAGTIVELETGVIT
ncbi:hypothetical protein ACFL6K_05425 [Candidatus Latescibacterota bacterium]